MTVQDDEAAGQHGDQRATEKPEPDEQDRQKAAEMMTAYQDRPTLVLPGSGGMVSGTAVNDWLDEDGNPKYGVPDDAGSDAKAEAGDAQSGKGQVEKDKALNEELKKVSAAENKGEKR
ncbi:hypothetical protein H7H82_11525 [Mycobacterium heidelbergense]|uniref:Uncharacterized protein n=1 Tax=Mycobacterium heidelbergense TaxID=53376 RepID=A0A1X0DLI6_MYCHE|nr:hypothetical protein [Mycobacterium heidelbergense]MCV7051218.1 hypothetical protein [Mycobacterium heidelbergense]ORA73215.1 hypothetical protein BST25_12845 [Mycobacterium heidelbergense]BBZ52050.1 hypothetical protein MHEI_37670 [Mycobacterium heidelbergense]